MGSGTYFLEFQLAMEGRWLLCCISTPHRRLVDLLNAHRDRAMLVHIDDCGDGSAEDATARGPADTLDSVNTRSILFGIPIEISGTAAGRGSPSWIEKVKQRVRIGIGRYEIVGDVHLPKGIVHVAAAVSELDGFFPVTDASVRREGGRPGPKRVVIVNSERVDFIRYEPAGAEASRPAKGAAGLGRDLGRSTGKRAVVAASAPWSGVG